MQVERAGESVEGGADLGVDEPSSLKWRSVDCGLTPDVTLQTGLDRVSGLSETGGEQTGHNRANGGGEDRAVFEGVRDSGDELLLDHRAKTEVSTGEKRLPDGGGNEPLVDSAETILADDSLGSGTQLKAVGKGGGASGGREVEVGEVWHHPGNKVITEFPVFCCWIMMISAGVLTKAEAAPATAATRSLCPSLTCWEPAPQKEKKKKKKKPPTKEVEID